MFRSSRLALSLPRAAGARLLTGVAGVLLLGSALWAADEPKGAVDEATLKLKELNPGFDGKVGYRVEGGAVTEIRVVTDKVTDISPLRAFDSLRVLDCSGTHANWARGNGQLADLAPLKGMKLAGLTALDLSFTKVGDAGMVHFKDCKNLKSLALAGTSVADAGVAHFADNKGLTSLNLARTKVTDAGLAHFRDCKELTSLNATNTKVSDDGLGHFKDCNGLTVLWLSGTQVGDAGLAHLKGHKNLTTLHLSGSNVGDEGLAHLKDCPALKALYLAGTQVSDLSPLRGVKLTVLHCQGAKVTDLSPLKALPLKELRCDFKFKRDAEILRSIKTLETINEKPAAQFWKEAEAKKP